MCIILTAEAEPSSTRLFNIPVILNDYKHNCLIYSNDLAVSTNSNNPSPDNPSNNFFSELLGTNINASFDNHSYVAPLQQNDNQNQSNSLMIVAIPNIHKVDNFGLVDISTDKIKQFRSKTVDICKPLVKTYKNSYTNSFDGEEKLRVNDIGNYLISVSPNLDSLLNSIDWDQFILPPDIQTRIDTFKNKTLFPFECAYVVAKAKKNIKDDGFGVLYLDPGFTYMPVCHEMKQDSNVCSYDVCCYNFSNKPSDKVNFFNKNKHNIYATNFNVDTTLLNLVNDQCTMSKNGNKISYKVDSNNLVLNHVDIKGELDNQNLYF